MPPEGAAGRFIRRLRPGRRAVPAASTPSPAPVAVVTAVPPLEPAPIAPVPAAAAPTSVSIAPARMRELEAEATYAHERLTLARRRAMLGRGRPNRLAELERIADGADRRLRAAKHE